MAEFAEPAPFDYWLEYLAHEPDLAQWEDTFDTALVNWQLDLCWRLLRLARQRATEPPDQARIRYSQGRLQAQSGRWSEAFKCYQAALKGFPSTDSDYILLLGDLGMMYRLQGDGQAALATHRRQLDLSRVQKSIHLQAEALDQLALDCELVGDWAAAYDFANEALVFRQSLNDVEALAVSLKHLGLIEWRQGQHAQARSHLEQARDIFERTEQVYDAGQAEGNLGNLCYEEGDPRRAEQHYLNALKAFDRLGVVFDKVGVLNNLGGLAIAREDWAQALQFCQESAALAHDLGDRRGERDACLNLGLVGSRQGKLDQADQQYHLALTLSRGLQDWPNLWMIRRRQLKLVFRHFLNGLNRRLKVWLAHLPQTPNQ